MDIAKANSSGSQPMLNGKPVYSGETPMAKGMVAGFQEFQKDQSRFLRDYQSNKDMLVSLGRAFTRYQAGGGEASRAIADLDGIAKKLDIENVLPANWRGDAAGFALATKIATQAAFKVIQDSGANRAPRTGLQEALVTSARAEADPAANWKIITNGLATLEYAHDLYNNPDSFKSINVNKNIAAFDASHPLDRYLDKAQKETPMFKGVTPKTYQMVTGKASLVQDPKTKDIYDPDVPSAHWNEKGEVVP
jgi:hypothetical protein